MSTSTKILIFLGVLALLSAYVILVVTGHPEAASQLADGVGAAMVIGFVLMILVGMSG